MASKLFLIVAVVMALVGCHASVEHRYYTGLVMPDPTVDIPSEVTRLMRSDLEPNEVWQGSVYETELTFMNFGTTAITLSKAESGCHCTHPELRSFLLEPEQEGTVSVTVETKGIRETTPGRVIVHQTHPEVKKIVLSYDVPVRPAYWVEDDTIDLMYSAEASQTVDLRVFRLHGEGNIRTVLTRQAEIEVLGLSDDSYSDSVSEVPVRYWDVKLKVAPSSFPFFGFVKFVTDDGLDPLSVAITAYKKDEE